MDFELPLTDEQLGTDDFGLPRDPEDRAQWVAGAATFASWATQYGGEYITNLYDDWTDAIGHTDPDLREDDEEEEGE